MTAERPVEIELKYRVRDVAAGERFLAAETLGPFKATSAARTAQHEDRYLDTSDGALARAGFAARLRQTNGSTVVTVKGTRPPDGAMARREELEGPADRSADPSDWPPSAARSLILELCGDLPLVELVTVRQLRRKRKLKAGDATAELSLDEVDVVARGRVIDRFVELEVELTSGTEDRLARAWPRACRRHGPGAGAWIETRGRARGFLRRRRCRGGGPIEPPGEAPEPGSGRMRQPAEEASAASPSAKASSTRSKPSRNKAARSAARSAAAASGGSPSPEPAAGEDDVTPVQSDALVVGKTPGVVADDIVAEAGRKVLRFHLARMIAREEGTRAGTNLEDLHSMRVATRRMRAAWRVFGDGFRDDRTRHHRKRLRTVAGRLGAVRDLDVLIEAGEGYLGNQSKLEQRALQPLFAAWRGQRDDARVLLLRELDSEAYARWVDEFRDFVRTDGLGAASVLPTAPHRIRDTAASRIWAAFEVVRAYEPTLRWADVPTLHELRIAAKWLRYTLEFVKECLGPDAAPLIAKVTALQDHLGLMHDADVAASMARAFLVEHAGRLSETETAAIGRYLIDREREVTRLRPLRRTRLAGHRRSRLPARPRSGSRSPLAFSSRSTPPAAGEGL